MFEDGQVNELRIRENPGEARIDGTGRLQVELPDGRQLTLNPKSKRSAKSPDFANDEFVAWRQKDQDDQGRSLVKVQTSTYTPHSGYANPFSTPAPSQKTNVEKFHIPLIE